jgi:hypothetical protein
MPAALEHDGTPFDLDIMWKGKGSNIFLNYQSSEK